MNHFRLVSSVMAASLFVLTGCSGTPAAPNTPASSGTADQGQVQKIKFYFPVQVAGPLSQKMEALIADFQKANKDVQVELVFAGNYNESFQKIMTANMSGNPPEVALVGGGNQWALKDANALEPLDSYVAKAGGDQFLADFNPGFLADDQIDGKLWGLPFQKSTPVLYWNKEAFKKAGLDPSSPPQTWQQLREYATKLTVKEGATVKQWGVEIPGDYWNLESLIMQNGGQLSNEKGTQTLVDQQPAVEALQFMTDLANKDGVMPQKRSYPDSSQDFVAGQAAMIYNTPGGLAFVRDSAKFQFGVAPLPAGKQQSVPTGGAELVVFAKASPAKKEAAWKFISWLTEKEQAARWSMETGYVPVRKSATEVPAMKDYLAKVPQVQGTFDAATSARREQMGMHEGAKIMQFINTGVQQALAGQKSPQDVLNDVQKQASPLLTKYNK